MAHLVQFDRRKSLLWFEKGCCRVRIVQQSYALVIFNTYLRQSLQQDFNFHPYKIIAMAHKLNGRDFERRFTLSRRILKIVNKARILPVLSVSDEAHFEIVRNS